MKKNPFLILILLLFSFVTNVTAANAPKDDVPGPFVIKYTDAFGDEHTEYATTIQDAFDPSILSESIDKDKEINITLNSSFMDAMNPYTIVIENGLKYNFTNRESSGFSLLCIVDITIQDGGSLAINGQVDFERFPTFNFFLGCITVKASNPKSKLTIDGGYFVGIYNKPVLINEGFSSPLNTDVKIKHASFLASDGISVIKSRNFGLLADGCKFYELDAEGKETGVGLGENYYSSERFLAYASHEPVSAVVVREADKVFELSYTDISDDQHIEHYATMVDAVYTVGEEDKNVTITLIDDCINDDSFLDEISLGSCSAITYDFVSKGKKLIGGKYLFSATYHDGLTIFGDNTNTDIKATFNLGEGGGMIINGGRYSSRGSDDFFSIDVGSITITSGRFNSPEKGIWNNRKQIHLGSGKSYYEITYSDGEEKETKLDEKYDDNDHLINASDEIVKEVIVRGPITPYAELSSDGKTLTFKYDGFMPETNAWKVLAYKEDEANFCTPGWVRKGAITTVVFNESFQAYKPTSCHRWFDECSSLTKIEGIEYLNTENVQDMGYMFSGCEILENVNDFLSVFKTSEVLDMSYMFNGCKKLENVNLSNFNTSKVADMQQMFSECVKLSKITFGKDFSTGSVTSLYSMFYNCKALTELDLSTFNTQQVNDMQYMLADCRNLRVLKLGSNFKPKENCDLSGFALQCEKLETILVDEGYSCPPEFDTDNMSFLGCLIKSGNGTEFENPTKDYFRIDEDGNPGFLTTLPYTIKYVEDDKEVNYEGLPTEYNPYDANISFFANNSSTPIELTAPPSKEGYHFVGWSDVLNTGLKDVTETVKIDPSVDRFNRIYKANWEINQYTITFDTDGGSEIAAIKQDYNTAITKPADPVKTGYSFIGWDKGIPATMPAQDVTITAKWQINTHTITFDTYGGSEIKPIIYKYNAAITKPADPVKTGYTFKGWDNDIPSNMPDQDLSFKAQWQINKYTITFNTDCNIDIELMELDYGSDVKLPANLERKGFTFLGWDKDIKTMPAENITLTAQWRDDRIAIDAEFNGEVSFPANADNYCNGSEKTVTIDFEITQGVASELKLSFPNDVIPAVNGTIENDEGSIVITIPDNIESGVYTGKVVFVSADPEVYRPLESTITITATIPLRNAAVQLYTDMLIVDNHEGIYNAYQWYRNGEALSGATLLYYTEPKFDYNSLYTVKLSGDGKEMMSCPVEWLSTAKALKPSIKVYPNPAKQGENFTLEILDFDEDQNYDIVIFTANGTMVKKISNVEQKTSVTLPSGVYSGSLINGGEKKGFKLIVK